MVWYGMDRWQHWTLWETIRRMRILSLCLQCLPKKLIVWLMNLFGLRYGFWLRMNELAWRTKRGCEMFLNGVFIDENWLKNKYILWRSRKFEFMAVWHGLWVLKVSIKDGGKCTWNICWICTWFYIWIFLCI